MLLKDTWTRREIAEITGIPDRRVLFYTEQNILPGFFGAVGRGTARKYSRRDLFYFLVVKELDRLGLSLSRIKLIIVALHLRTLTPAETGFSIQFSEPKIWVDNTLIKTPVIMVVSLPQEHGEPSLSPEARDYDSSVFLQLQIGSEAVVIQSDRSSQLVLNLNRIFNKAEI